MEQRIYPIMNQLALRNRDLAHNAREVVGVQAIIDATIACNEGRDPARVENVEYVAGIVTGATIIFMFAVFEKKRSEVLRLIEELKEWER
jgi:predicted metal-dependent phosphotriesterase family hydrolase